MENSLYEEITKLKKIIRRGWQLRNVPGRLESDAEHTFSMLLLGLEIMEKNKLELDKLKVVKMIVYHELCEIDAGDTTPCDNVNPEQKYGAEYKCIKRLALDFNMPEIEKLWLEFEEKQTPEALFVKSLDKYDAVLQAQLYAYEHNMPELYEEFRNNALRIIENLENLNRK